MEGGILRGKEQCDLSDEQAEKKNENGKLYQLHTGDWIYVPDIAEHSALAFLRGQGIFLPENPIDCVLKVL